MLGEVEVVTWRSPEVVERDAGRTAPNLRREPERGSQVDRVPGGIGRGHRTFRRARAVGSRRRCPTTFRLSSPQS